VTTDAVRAGWTAGQAAYAAWLTLESPAATSVAARAGFDAVVVEPPWRGRGVRPPRVPRPPPRRVGCRP
jgi:hypothetical protein